MHHHDYYDYNRHRHNHYYPPFFPYPTFQGNRGNGGGRGD